MRAKNYSLAEAYIFGASPLGIFGAHHYYLRRYKWGLLYTFTVGIFGVGFITDLVRMSSLVERSNKLANYKQNYPGRYKLEKDRAWVDDAYLLSVPPLGLIGATNYYLGRTDWGILYTLTVGVLCIGWLFDLFRIPLLVRDRNATAEERLLLTGEHGVSYDDNDAIKERGSQDLQPETTTIMPVPGRSVAPTEGQFPVGYGTPENPPPYTPYTTAGEVQSQELPAQGQAYQSPYPGPSQRQGAGGGYQYEAAPVPEKNGAPTD